MGLRTIIMCLSIKSRAFSIWGGVGGRRRKQPSPQVLFLFVFFLPSEKQDPLYVCLYTTAVPEIPEAGSKRQQDVTTRSSCHWLFLEQPTPHFGSHGLVNLQCSSQTYILVLNGHHSPQKQANCFLHQAAHALRMSRADAQPRAHCSTQALHNSVSSAFPKYLFILQVFISLNCQCSLLDPFIQKLHPTVSYDHFTPLVLLGTALLPFISQVNVASTWQPSSQPAVRRPSHALDLSFCSFSEKLRCSALKSLQAAQRSAG